MVTLGEAMSGTPSAVYDDMSADQCALAFEEGTQPTQHIGRQNSSQECHFAAPMVASKVDRVKVRSASFRT